ncbi:hypothetical protein AU184_08850 [Mycolicibacterium novocastrense]|uniref:alpha/beta hydrolase n=1 Tax=Mycolicibacterium novocastrense TaxID=59813 RepID=UPI000746315B|nr:alpha/beta hydrolase [Mycolicibacterium novocastrense]KUH69824.1 hypothetical protein AU184_08850 [Mycolicibacterium novocastrense]KUH71373.1 hypothetical protein AU183_06220 [Mycolicibacterium novocastrense]KUH74437.1 hypothetical protein AU072_17635 [Mycolicibacterium novocastrense]
MSDFDSDVVPQIQTQVRRIGAKFDDDVLIATRDIYRPHLDMSPARERCNIAYGPHERHVLDLYRPAGKPEAVLVFVHGGGFIGGDKNEDGTFYVNVGRFFARQGVTAVVPNYRRAPEFGWPSGAHDVRDVIGWVRKTIDGVSDGRVPLFVLGQSAGASHVASWLFDADSRQVPLGRLAGAMLMSGYYRAVGPLPPHLQAYFGADEALYEARSPFTHAVKTDFPLWLSIAELDPGMLAARTYALAERVAAASGRSPAFAYFRSHNHVSTAMSLGSPQNDVGEEIMKFVRS